MGDSGHKPQHGENISARPEHHGDVFAPVPGAPGHETALGLGPAGRKAWQQGAQEVGWDLRGASVNLDGGGAATRHRTGLLHASLLPNLPAHPRHRKRAKRGRKRLFNAVLQA